MVLIGHVLLILYVFLLFSPIPPIYPRLPRPPQVASANHTVPRRSIDQVTSVTLQAQEQTTGQSQQQELHLLYTRVAARSLGEGAFALAEIACTIKNRLHISRNSLASVLRAYHARDVTPKPTEIEVVRQVFEDELLCPSTWWYAISLQDSYAWRPHQRPPVKTVKLNDRKQILIFER